MRLDPHYVERFRTEDAIGVVPCELEIIIPVRVHEGRADLIGRIERFVAESALPSEVSVLVVDDGSPEEYREELRHLEGPHLRIISTRRNGGEPFSLAAARNCGAQAARAPFLLFLDADLMIYPCFFEDIFREIEILGMHENACRFLMCPVIYLTEEGQTRWRELPPDMRRQFFISEVLKGDSSLIEKHSSGTSAIIISRDYFLARGGNDTRFSGWGYEDYEFACRLIRRARQFPLPANWLRSDGNFMTVNCFEGWKSVYRLHGDWLAQKGIWLFHAPHPVDAVYRAGERDNWALLQQRLTEDGQGAGELEPLPEPAVGVSLFLARNPFCYTREIAPYFGRVVFASKEDFANVAALEQTIRREAVDRLVFGNPYRDVQTLAAYRWCRDQNFPFIICERGALPDSVFHDKSGFLSDGASYHPGKWDKPPSPAEREATLAYIDSLRNGDHMLERQAPRMGMNALRRKLGIQGAKKILLVPFQQPGDTVVRHFAGPASNFERFHALVSDLPHQLRDEWVVLCKKHPVEDVLAPIPGAVNADDCNLYDLIELCDAMLIINSGTGLYGMMFGKPVHIAGESWYADPRMNLPIARLEDFTDAIRASFRPDHETVLRFVHYLRFGFYSFGEQIQRKARHDDNTPVTATTDIRYYEIRGLTERPVFYRDKPPMVSTQSLLFDRYRGAPITPTGGQKTRPSLARSANPKLAKLLRSPHAFFRDAKSPFLRPLRHIFST